MKFYKQTVLIILLLCCWFSAYAEDRVIRTRKGEVVVSYEIASGPEILVTKVSNKTGVQIIVKVDNIEPYYINAQGSAVINKVCHNKVSIASNHKTASDEIPQTTALVASTILSNLPAQPVSNSPEPEPRMPQPTENIVVSQPSNFGQPSHTVAMNPVMTVEELNEIIDSDEFWGVAATEESVSKAKEYLEKLNLSSDRKSFVENSDLQAFIENEQERLTSKEEEMTSFIIQNVIVFCSRNKNISTEIQNQIQTDITRKLQNRLKDRTDALAELNDAISASENEANLPFNLDKTDMINYGVIGVIVLLVLVLTVFMVSKRSKNKKTSNEKQNQSQSVPDVENPTIVVRRRTTSILKKLCIDDVVDNQEYKKIVASDFCQDSAVRNIYIKNTCVKEIYDIYAEDLRNADRPKEDGCMVLGRWIFDESTKSYDVTLESVVLPGEDAIFKEYELNFGGKIKLRVAEKLRKLRRDTNLQYDLTCWVHSHPGLGVFFSNSDSNVQMQLKHAQHPNFLVAFVIDILTDKQEMGIFTFRHDGSINSKQDLTQMYSLEDLYKWAIESNKRSFSAENYYNIMQNAELKTEYCRGVEMNNSAIIDLSQIAMESTETGLIGLVVGYQTVDSNGREFVISSVYKEGEQPSTGVMGCLISVPHMSLPTIQRIINNHHLLVNFVCAYSTRQMTLTTIPVVNGEVVNDERYYSEETLENLKIWTRRRR